VIRAALDTGAFDTFYLPDGMVGSVLNDRFSAELNGTFGAYPGTDSPGAALFVTMAEGAGFDGTSAFAPESYDAAALIMLAMAKAGSSNSADFKDHVFDVANEPGEVIYPGELAKALELIAAGQDVNYEGASAVELIGPGESAGNYQEIEFKDGAYSTIGFR
jgi:branched-chain amino acid transport system substrate-binding protein